MINKSQRLVLVLALLVATASCGSFDVTISCTPCKDTCGFPSCYKVTSMLYSGQTCGQENCVLNKDVIMKIDKCDYDFYGNSCQTGICFYPNSTGCINTDLTAAEKAQFTTGTWTQLSCGDCTTTADCTKCRILQKLGVSQPSEQCLGSNCNGLQTVNITSSNCQNNLSPQGNPCQYCYSASYTANPLGICTVYNSKFNSLAFRSYAKVRTLWQNLYTVMSLVILCIALIAFN